MSRQASRHKITFWATKTGVCTIPTGKKYTRVEKYRIFLGEQL